MEKKSEFAEMRNFLAMRKERGSSTLVKRFVIIQQKSKTAGTAHLRRLVFKLLLTLSTMFVKFEITFVRY